MDAKANYTTAQMAVNHSPFYKGQFVSVRYTRTVKNRNGELEPLFAVWCGDSGAKYPSELFSSALTRFTI